MSEKKKDFKVVIVGGGVAGLTLANMLEKFDIDWVLLEGHGDIAPAVGASIGMLANGLRILDQIGCYDSILALPQQFVLSAHTRNAEGKSLFEFRDASERLKTRHGYPFLFFDRQWLLQVLYSHLRHKDRVLVNMKVTRVDHVDGGVQVTTKDGQKVKGTLVMGVDGVHSTVRAEMMRIGNELQPGYFSPGEPDRVPCYYRCSFGIAQHVDGYVTGELNNVRARGWSALIISGPENRVYWFIFDKLPQPKYGKSIPTYTKEDEARFVKKYWDYPITDKVKFGQIYSKKLTSTLTPLHEIVYEKWFFKRIMLLGDSAHKPDPISGQGGNGAIESVAELVNAIVRMRDSRPGGLTGLTDSEIGTIFQQTQSARHERAKRLVADARMLQSLSAYENRLLSKIVWEYLGPNMGEELGLSFFSTPIVGGSRLEKLPVPHRGRTIPFTDELPAKPQGGVVGYVIRGFFIAAMISLIWLASKSLRAPHGGLDSWNGETVISRPWSRDGKGLLGMLVSVFSYALEADSVATRVHLVYFLSQLATPVLMYTVDGYRQGYQGTLLTLPSIFLGVMQLMGIAYMAPLHALIGAFHSTVLPATRLIPKDVSDVLIPALTLGYAIPTALMLLPGTNIPVRQDIIAFWQVAPVLVPAFTALFVTGLRRWRSRRQQQQKGPEWDYEASRRQTAEEDCQSLESVYTHNIAVQATLHIATLAYAHFNPHISIAEMFLGVPNPLDATWKLPNTASEVAVLLKFDLAIASTAWFARGLYSIWNLRRHGYIRTQEALKAAISAFLGQIIIGPGATWTSLAYWEERVLANFKQNPVE
ncbi:FAD binding domain protein [Biscogniauxia mediterranea]|nr:FAD binding domain protein [Biscogniauxia mediterranea]